MPRNFGGGRARQGTTDHPVDQAAVSRWILGAGDSAEMALGLHEAVEESVPRLTRLSPVTTPLAGEHLARLTSAMPALTREVAAGLVIRGYAARMLVQNNPGSYGAPEPPLLDGLPEQPRPERAYRALGNLVVKMMLRRFDEVRALPQQVWEGFSICTTWRVHDDALAVDDNDLDPDGGSLHLLSVESVEGVLRFGWMMRLVDLDYGLGPALSLDGSEQVDAESSSVCEPLKSGVSDSTDERPQLPVKG